MKKIFTIFLLFICAAYSAKAQYYTFSHSSETYTELTNPTIITTDFKEEGYALKLGFPFKFHGINFNADGDSLEVELFGAILARNKYNDKMFGIEGFAVGKFLARDAASSISYTLEGEAGKRILKVQYKNVTPRGGDPMKDYVNYQTWMYEDGSKVEIRIGPTNIEASSLSKIFIFDTQKGPQIGIFLSSMDFSKKHDVQLLVNNPENPNLSTNINASLTGIPMNGKVYTYLHKEVVVPAKLELLSPIAMEQWKVGEKRMIKWKSHLVKTIKIEYSVNGFSNYRLIAENVDATLGQYEWTIPNTPSEQCAVKVTDEDNPDRYFETALPFTIKSATSIGGITSATGGFNVFPNPSNGRYNISHISQTAEILYINVTSLDGKTVFTNKLNNKSPGHSIDITTQPAGMYILSIITNEGTFTQLLKKD